MTSGTVQLHLLRHAHAGNPAKWHKPDDQRPLSDRGRGQAEALGRHLAAVGQPFDLLVSSPLLRARQTAELVAARLDLTVVIDNRLAGGAGIADVEAILAEQGNPARPILVGHDPDLSDLVTRLSGASDIAMAKGALARIDIERPLRAATGLLVFLLPPLIVPG